MWPPASGCLTQSGSEAGQELAQDRKPRMEARGKPGTWEGQLRVYWLSAGVGRAVRGRKCPGDPRGQNWDPWQKRQGGPANKKYLSG